MNRRFASSQRGRAKEVAFQTTAASIGEPSSSGLPLASGRQQRSTTSSHRTQAPLLGRFPAWSILTSILALTFGIFVGMYHWHRDRNELQRWYFTSYIRSAMSESHSSGATSLSRYQVIDLIDDRHPEQTLTTVTDEDAAVTANGDGTFTLKYTDKWTEHKHLRAVIRTITVENEVMHGWLQEKVYGFQGIDELLREPLKSGTLAAGVLFLAGMLFAFPADRRRADRRV